MIVSNGPNAPMHTDNTMNAVQSKKNNQAPKPVWKPHPPVHRTKMYV